MGQSTPYIGRERGPSTLIIIWAGPSHQEPVLIPALHLFISHLLYIYKYIFAETNLGPTVLNHINGFGLYRFYIRSVFLKTKKSISRSPYLKIFLTRNSEESNVRMLILMNCTQD